MKSKRWVPMLTHPATGVPMPWADTRMVPLSTLVAYLGRGADYVHELAAAGWFAHAGCTETSGEKRPQVSYCPAVIWHINQRLPSPVVMHAMLSGSDALDQLRNELRALCEALPRAAGSAA